MSRSARRFLLGWALLAPLWMAGQLDSLLGVLPLTSGEERIRTLGEIAWQLGFSDPGAALVHAREADSLARGLSDPALEAQAANDLAIAEHRLGRVREAIVHNRRSLALRVAIGDSAGVGSSSSKLGSAYNELVQLDSALYFHLRALRIFGDAGDSLRGGQTLGNLSRVYELLGEIEVADSVARQAVSYLHRAPDYPKAMALAQWSNLLLKQQRYAEAEEQGEMAMELFSRIGARSELAGLANNLGVMARDRGDAERGAYYYRLALEAAEQADDRNGATHYSINLANVLADQGRLEEALARYREALVTSRREGYGRLEEVALEGLVIALERSGRTKEALREQRTLMVLKDSLRSAERLEQLADMEVKYSTERTERELAEERASSAVQKAELERQRARNLVLAGGLGLVLLLAIGAVLVQRARARNRLQQNVIAEREKGIEAAIASAEEERRRIARELHDGVGQQLGGLRMQAERFALSEAVESSQVTGLVEAIAAAGTEVRRISHGMMPKALAEVGLVPALRDMLGHAFPEGVAEFDHHGLEVRLPEHVETGLFRVTQELVNNIVKHSGATSVSVQLSRLKDRVVLLVEDNGCGFDPKHVGTGLGMRTLADRVRIMDGRLDIDSAPGSGTRVTIRVPVPA